MTEKYGAVAPAVSRDDYSPHPLLVDAGCGAALSALERENIEQSGITIVARRA